MDTNSFSKDSILHNLYKSIDQPFLFSKLQCCLLENYVQDVIKSANAGFYKEHSIDRALLRTKYFFGERYTYGAQMPQKGFGMERLYPLGLVDRIPSWIHSCVINPLVAANIIEANFVNSAVINEYLPGGCIASHIDPPHIFDRPLISISLFSDSALCFGCKFEYKPIRCSEPILQLPLPRGIVTLLSGFAANDITHCVRPEDTKFYRVVIVLRRVLPNAPRLSHLNTLLSGTSLDLVASASLKLEREKNSEGILKKFYEKYSKVRKGKRNKYGGVSKVAYTRKTFFADNKQYTNRPYKLNDM